MLRDVSKNSMVTSTLGMNVDFPIGLSPVALHKLADPKGELATVAGNLQKLLLSFNIYIPSYLKLLEERRILLIIMGQSVSGNFSTTSKSQIPKTFEVYSKRSALLN